LTNPLGQAKLSFIMTIHVNIGEAKTRFSELCAAALRGEEVIVQNAGVPKLKLVPLQLAMDLDRTERRKRVDANQQGYGRSAVMG
jgi:antitoxin (DNA-binding transcriptional repressor) of toxin-antitoxin stability system